MTPYCRSSLPARRRHLKWSNFDATLFWATDNITTDAFPPGQPDFLERHGSLMHTRLH